MVVAVADTHAAIWYLANDQRLSQRAEVVIDKAQAKRDRIGLSSISLVEIVYLTEKGRVPSDMLKRFMESLSQSDSVFLEIPVDHAIVLAVPRVPRAAVPDMPDHIIAATALHLSVPLISRDAKIQVSGMTTIW